MSKKEIVGCQQSVIGLKPSPNDSQVSSLQAAVDQNQKEVGLLLRQEFTNPDAGNSNKQQSLSQAAERGDHLMVKELLKDDTLDPNSKYNDCTPLFWAVKTYLKIWERGQHRLTKYYTVVELLLKDPRVDPNCGDSDDRTPLSHAAECGQDKLVELLLKNKHIDLDSADEGGRTPLSWAMKCFENNPFMKLKDQDCRVVNLLLDQGTADSNSRDNQGRTPLSWAIQYMRHTNNEIPSVFDLLLSRSRVCLASTDVHGRTLFSRAAEAGKTMVIVHLLKQGIYPDLRDEDGRTPLSQAAEHGHKAVVELLLKKEDVNPDSSDNDGRRPLWWAARAGREEIVKSLLATKRINPELIDTDGHTPLSCAIDNGHSAIVSLLINKDRVTLHKLAQKGTFASLRSLLKSGMDVNIKDADGRTPLHIAALSGRVNIAKELINWGADIDCKDVNGKTPLRAALRQAQQDIVQLLLQHSAQTENIMLAEWLDAYKQSASDNIFVLSHMSCGKKSVQFVETRRVKMSNGTGPTRQLS
jgi:ankyrin repeat protein